jgi:carbon-monoxide dehydrogenase medium subunit
LIERSLRSGITQRNRDPRRSSRGELILKAAAFDYVRAKSVAEVVALLSHHAGEAKVLAGGQSLLPALNLRLSAPALLIDIGHIESLRGITYADGLLRIGAMTTHAQLAASPEVARHAPLLTRAIAHVAHPAIRSRGTIGGSLANADPAAELPACALALQARIVAQGPAGERRIAADAFFTGLFETALAEDEVLVAIEIPPAPKAKWGFAELSRRSGDYAIVGLAAQDWRLAYFAVGTQATLARRAGAALAAGITPANLSAASAALADDLEPHGDQQATPETRLHLARVLLRRVVGPWAA